MSIRLGSKGAEEKTEGQQNPSRRAAPGACAQNGMQQGRLPGKSSLSSPGGSAKHSPETVTSRFGSANELATPRGGRSGPSSRQSPMTPRASGPVSPTRTTPRTVNSHKIDTGNRDGLLAAQQLLAKKLDESGKVSRPLVRLLGSCLRKTCSILALWDLLLNCTVL